MGIIEKKRLAKERVDYAEELIANFRKKGVVMPSAIRLLRNAKRHFERNKYDEAMDAAKKVKEESKRVFKAYLMAKDFKKKLNALRETAPDEVVREIDDLLKSSEKDFVRGRYEDFNRNAEALVRHLKEKARKLRRKEGGSVEEKEEAIKYLQAVTFEALDAQKRGLPISDVESLLKKGKDAIVGGFYKEAISLADQALDVLQKIKDKHNGYVRKIEEAGDAIQVLKNSGMKTTVLERILKKARAALQDVAYDEVMEHLDRIYERIEETKATYSNAINAIQRADELIHETREAGANVSLPATLLEDAKMAEEAGDYVQALKLAQNAYDETVKVIQSTLDRLHKEEIEYKQLENLIKEAEAAIEECREYVSIPAAEEMLENARECLKRRELFDEARRLASDARALATATKNQYIETMDNLQQANSLMANLELLGISSPEDENLIEKVVQAIDGENYLQALQISKDAVTHLQSLSDMVNSAREAIERAKNLLEEGRAILSDEEYKANRKCLEEAKEALKERRIDEAKEKADRVIRDLSGVLGESKEMHMKVKAQIDRIETLVSLFQKDGIVVDPVFEVLNSAKDRLKKREFENAMEDVKTANELMKAIKDAYEQAKTTISASEMVLSGMKQRGIDVGDLEHMLKKAKDAYEKGDYNTAYNVAKEIQDKGLPGFADMKSMEAISEFIERARRRMEAVKTGIPEVVEAEKNLGLDPLYSEYYRRLLYCEISQALDALKKATESLSLGDMEGAKDIAERASRRAEEIVSKYVGALTSLKEVRDLIQAVSRPEAEELYKRAKSAMEMGNYGEAISLAERVKDMLPAVPTVKPLPVKDEIHMRQEGAIVMPIEEAYDTISVGRVIPASHEQMQVESPVIKPIDSEAEKDVEIVLRKAERTINQFEDVDINVDDARALLASARKAFDEGDYASARNFANQARVTAVKAAEEILSRERSASHEVEEIVRRVEKIVQDLRDKGVENRTVDLLLERAHDALKGGKLRQAHALAEEAEKKIRNIKDEFERARSMLKKAEEIAARSDRDVDLILKNARIEFESGNFRYVIRLAERIMELIGAIERPPAETYTGVERPGGVIIEGVPEESPVTVSEWVEPTPPETAEPPLSTEVSADQGVGSLSKEEWLREHERIKMELLKLKEGLLRRKS